MRVCDYIAQRLYAYGIRHVYGITGGGASGLNDGFAKHGGIRWIGNHHEQASAFAAMGQAKLTGRLAVVNPTTGCGGTNCITGVLDAWQDSVPILFISGNVNRAQMTAYHEGPRKQGVQEADIIPLVEPITKYANVVGKPEDIVRELEYAIWTATHGRKGPVWLDIPTDVQCAEFEPTEPPALNDDEGEIGRFACAIRCRQSVLDALSAAKRPLVLLGAGARDARQDVRRFLYAYDLPFVCTYGAIDLFAADDVLYVGRVGIKGDRAGNFALAHCDLLIVLGSSLSTPVTGYDLSHFASEADIVVVDIEDISKGVPDVMTLDRVTTYVQTTVETFVSVMAQALSSEVSHHGWINLCLRWRAKWPVCAVSYEPGAINLYAFVDALSKVLPANAAIVSDAGSAIYVPCQGLKLRGSQRHIISLAQADMGFALPASIGVALEGVPTIVLTGDGSFQTNLQELATIRALKLPIKIFVWNNSGYLSIRATQRKLYEGRLMGTDEEHGLWFPRLIDVAQTYEMAYHRMLDLEDGLDAILAEPGAALIEVICPPDQPIIPTIKARRNEDGTIGAAPLFDMAPALPPEEIAAERAAALAL